MTAGAARRWRDRVLLVAAGAVAARVALSAARAAAPTGARGGGSGPGPDPGSGWDRTNYRGRTVSLAGGPALAAAAAVSAAAGAPGPRAAAAGLVAGLGSGAVGLYDDLVGGRPEHRAKGFHGHLAALRSGRVTSGVVKIAGVGAAALAAAVLLPRRGTRRPKSMINAGVDVALGAGVIAGAANLLNLLDLRPGRALKVGVLVGVPLAGGTAGAGAGAAGMAAGVVGAAGALLPEDLAEETMLGDCGANALGAVLGAALVARTGRVGRTVALGVIAALTAVSERVSFTAVIGRTPGLRELDGWGRRRDDPAPAGGGSEPLR
ncbi:MAG: hypothetical protein GEV12_19485 [Micromonosporaceae bacterium]|nr:hypothetical protein [Micromonosporaceae bacterium]